MKKKTVSKIFGLGLSAAMLVSMAACGGSDSSGESNSTQSQSTAAASSADAKKEPVQLTILTAKAASNNWSNYPDNPIAKQIEEKTGVKFVFEGADTDKWNTIKASGDLPDIVRVGPDEQQMLIEGGLIIPLDDLVKTNGPDITANIPDALEFSRKNWSNNTGKLYFLPLNVLSEPPQHILSVDGQPGINLRWDYYKEIGTPAINTPDDLLNVLKQMQEKHPTTPDGKKVYGLSGMNDFGGGLWLYRFFSSQFTGYATRNAGDLFSAKMDSTTLVNTLTDTSSNIWTSIYIYYKASQMGLLDPDTMTMKFDDFTAKASAGQLLCVPVNWSAGTFNADNAAKANGFVYVPAGKYTWFNEINPSGMNGQDLVISKNCKKPDRAMDFINYMYTYEGSRAIWSGLEGKQWDMVNGVPAVKQETIDLQAKGGAGWEATGVQLDKLLAGLGQFAVNPKDNTPMNLFQTPDYYKKGLTPLYKDYSAQYKVDYPGQVFEKMLAEEKTISLTSETSDTAVQRANSLIVGSMPVISTDMMNLQTEVRDLFVRGIPKCILAKSDTEYKKAQEELIASVKAAGLDELEKYFTDLWNQAKTKAGAK